MESRARQLWLLTEPLHAVTYFDERCRGIGRAMGLRGFWQGYFAARTAPLPFLPGVATASDLMRGLDAGLNRFKFFPAETSGGAAALKALYGPFGECRFCPTGGVGEKTAPAYLALPNVLCVGGAWVAPADAVRAGDWDRITTLAHAAAALRQEPVA